MLETFHLKFIKHNLDVKLTTNSAMVYAEIGSFPLSIDVNLCIVKIWFKILNSDVHNLIHIVYHHLFAATTHGRMVISSETYFVY